MSYSHLYELHGNASLFLSASSLESLVGNCRGSPEVDDQVEREADVGVEPVVPREQHLQLGTTQGTLLSGVLKQKVENFGRIIKLSPRESNICCSVYFVRLSLPNSWRVFSEAEVL